MSEIRRCFVHILCVRVAHVSLDEVYFLGYEKYIYKNSEHNWTSKSFTKISHLMLHYSCWGKKIIPIFPEKFNIILWFRVLCLFLKTNLLFYLPVARCCRPFITPAFASCSIFHIGPVRWVFVYRHSHSGHTFPGIFQFYTHTHQQTYKQTHT